MLQPGNGMCGNGNPEVHIQRCGMMESLHPAPRLTDRKPIYTFCIFAIHVCQNNVCVPLNCDEAVTSSVTCVGAPAGICGKDLENEVTL